jgi:hypothetical protein
MRRREMEKGEGEEEERGGRGSDGKRGPSFNYIYFQNNSLSVQLFVMRRREMEERG